MLLWSSYMLSKKVPKQSRLRTYKVKISFISSLFLSFCSFKSFFLSLTGGMGISVCYKPKEEESAAITKDERSDFYEI